MVGTTLHTDNIVVETKVGHERIHWPPIRVPNRTICEKRIVEVAPHVGAQETAPTRQLRRHFDLLFQAKPAIPPENAQRTGRQNLQRNYRDACAVPHGTR